MHWKAGESEVPSIYQELVSRDLSTEFTGYDTTEQVSGRVLAVLKANHQVDILEEGEEGEVILDRSPFYAEAGGQVAFDINKGHFNVL